MISSVDTLDSYQLLCILTILSTLLSAADVATVGDGAVLIANSSQ